MRINDACSVSIYKHISVIDLTKFDVMQDKVQPHWSLSAILFSPIFFRAATSELLVAFPVANHACNMAILQFSASPSWLLLISLRRGKSISSPRPSNRQLVRPCKLIKISNNSDLSGRAGNSRSAQWKIQVRNSSLLILTQQSFCWGYTLGCWWRRSFGRARCLHLLTRAGYICACVHARVQCRLTRLFGITTNI